MRNRKNTNEKNQDIELNELLDKLIKLQEGSQSPSFLKKTVYIVTGICVILFVILICCNIYKNNFSMESILSTLLAFFSIFISIFFYFKADETSTRFYESSYKFMKEISVTLGKIEERFGEKLNSLDDKVSHLDRVSRETTAEIEDKQEDKDSLINELMEKANLNEEEKERYRKELEEKEEEIETLKRHKFRAEQESEMLRQKMMIVNTEESSLTTAKRFYTTLIQLLTDEEKAFRKMTKAEKIILEKKGYIDMHGNVNTDKIMHDLNNVKMWKL